MCDVRYSKYWIRTILHHSRFCKYALVCRSVGTVGRDNRRTGAGHDSRATHHHPCGVKRDEPMRRDFHEGFRSAVYRWSSVRVSAVVDLSRVFSIRVFSPIILWLLTRPRSRYNDDGRCRRDDTWSRASNRPPVFVESSAGDSERNTKV